MSVTIDGIVSGFDTTSLIDAILAASAAPIASMEEKLENDRATLQKVTEFSSHLESISSKIGDLQSGGLELYTATVPEGAGFAATAHGSVAQGTYEVDALALASSEMEASQGYADADIGGTIGHGTISVTIGGEVTDVTVGADNDSLTGLAASLNEVDGINAYVLNTGSETDPFKLVVQGKNSGAENTVEIDTSGVAGGPTFTETRAAADAHLTINGIDVYSASNDVQAVPGLTIDLDEAGLGPSLIEVGLDNTGIEEAVQSFVDTYNEAISFFNINTVYNAEEDLDAPLTGERTVARTVESLGNLVSSNYPGAGDGLSILAQLGVTTLPDGQLKLDNSTLQTAMREDFDDVLNLLTSEDGPFSALKTQIDDVFVDPDSGTLKSRTDSLESGIEDLEERIEKEEDRITDYAEILRSQFTAMEVAMSELQTTTQFLNSYFGSDS